MTKAAESTASATLSGRELALKRRQAMALNGKAGVVKTAAGRQAATPRPVSAAAVFPAATAEPARSVSDAELVARLRAADSHQASRARREAMSRSGKAALQPTAARPTSPN